jgi:actin related protein 2/3 complex subunit 5
MSVLSAIKSTDIATALKSLNVDQMDVLMKYVYKGMAGPETYNPAILLQWHEKLVETAGLGCIVRVLTDRKTV